MSTLVDIKSLITAVNSNIYIGDLPDTPDNCISLYQTGGLGTIHSIGNVAAEQQTMQVRVRNASYETAITEANEVKDILDGYNNTVVNTDLYLSIFLDSDILNLGKDDRGRTNFTLNFIIRKKRQ